MRLKHFPGSSDGLRDENLIEHYLNDGLNKFVFDRAAKKCYWPTTQILLDHVDTFKGQRRKFKFAFNFSGIWFEQCERWHPDLLDLLKQLAKSKMVEFLGSTYYHSLASLFPSKNEFIEQIELQNQLIKDLLGVKPKVFMNTEMIFNNLIAKSVEDLGYKAIFTEGVDRILGWRSPNYVYARGPVKEKDLPLRKRIRVLLRNYRLSDDIGYRFSSKHWDQWPLTAEKYAIWLSSTPGQVINIFIDFETFGEHHPEESGIFFFLKALPWKIFDWQNLNFATPSEILRKFKPVGEIDVHEFNTISWADMERDTSAWLGNSMQQMAFEELKKLEVLVKRNGNKHLLRLWRLFQQSDHLYYMCTKWWEDGDVHKYFSPFSTPHDGFINIISGISEIKVRIAKEIGRIEAMNMRRKSLKPESKVTSETKKKKRKIKPKLYVREEKKPITETFKLGTGLEKILEEDVIYPEVTMDLNGIQRVSKELSKRTR
jgi:alpha-amylase